MKTGCKLIARERGRQRAKYSDEHDDRQAAGALSCRATQELWDGYQGIAHVGVAGSPYFQQPEKAMVLLVKAGALIAAEIDRLLRAEKKLKIENLKWHAVVEDDGDEVSTPMPATCQKFSCREHHLQLVSRNGFMVCPRCAACYGGGKSSQGAAALPYPKKKAK